MSRKSRGKKELLGQFTIRFYKGNPIDELIFETLDPLATGLLRATLIEALKVGLGILKKQGWPLLTSATVEKQQKQVLMMPAQTVPTTTPQTTADDKKPVKARSALDELMHSSD